MHSIQSSALNHLSSSLTRLSSARRWLGLLSLVVLTAGCGTRARQTYLVPNYQSVARTEVVRVEVVTSRVALSPPPEGAKLPPAVLEMWGLMTQRYLNDHRDFLALGSRVELNAQAIGQGGPPEPSLEERSAQASRALAGAQCSPQIKGRLIVVGDAQIQAEDADLTLWAELSRCPASASGSRASRSLWRAEVAHRSASADPVLVTLRAQYVKRFGAEVAPYVAPSFLAIKALLDLAPRPKLTLDDDVMEKIELDD